MLRSIFRTVLLALTVLGGGVLFSSAHAAFPPTTQTEWSCGVDSSRPQGRGFSSNQQEALALWADATSSAYGHPRWIDDRCRATSTINGTTIYSSVYVTRSVSVCPADSTLTGANCVCDVGYEEQGSSCVAVSLCDVGKARTVNVTTGWARGSRPDANDIAIDYGLPPLHDYNDGVCVGNISQVDGCFRSQEPGANGLYRLSCDFTMIMTGDAMSSGDVNADALNPIPSCPGFLGEINGKPACVGTASSPLPSDPLPSGAPSPQPGNPTAGEKPTTGEGSGSTGAGRTPTSGSGGNTGGPASAAVRPGWSSPSPGEDTGQPCGGPGQPICAVKVDETGTPSASSADGYFNGPSSGLDAQKGILDGLLGDILDWDIGSWTWTFQLPTGCTPLEMYEGVVVNPCLWLDEFHSIMSFVWVLTGICGLFVIYSRAF